MNHLSEELRTDPELAERLLADAGKIGLAYLATQVRLLGLELDRRDKQIANAHAKIGDLERRLEAVIVASKKLKAKTACSIEILQNQIKGK